MQYACSSVLGPNQPKHDFFCPAIGSGKYFICPWHGGQRWSASSRRRKLCSIFFLSTICQQYFNNIFVNNISVPGTVVNCGSRRQQYFQQYIFTVVSKQQKAQIMFNNIFAFSGQRKPAAPPWPEGIRKNEPPYTISNKCNCTKI